MLSLLLANVGYFAWAHGLLASYGFAPEVQAEPQRLKQQIQPEAIQLLSPGEPAPVDPQPIAANPAPNAGQCLQAGLFSAAQAVSLRAGLQAALPAGSWALEDSVEPGRWIIYMGRYANAEALAKKRNELRVRGVTFEPLLNPALLPGLSLGHFSSQADANAGMSQVILRGVRTARVLQERPESRGLLLKLASADAPLLAQLDTLKPELVGKALLACP